MSFIPIREYCKNNAKNDKVLFKTLMNKIYGRIATRKIEEGKDFVIKKVKKEVVQKLINEDYKV
jgi:hypothetical protein